MTAHPLTPDLEALMEALPADTFRMGGQLVGGIIVAAYHSPDMLRKLRDLLSCQPSHSPSLTQPHHPLREALGLVDRGHPGAAALFEEDWVKYASRGELFGIINPESGLILTLPVEWGVDSNRCLNQVMALDTIESLDPVGWCLDAGADYQIVIDSPAAWKDQALEVVYQHPSWRRMALSKALPKRAPDSEVRAL